MVLNSHDLVVRHTISVLISQLLLHFTISHDLAEILLRFKKNNINRRFIVLNHVIQSYIVHLRMHTPFEFWRIESGTKN